jgi:hypothetical protein
MVNNDQVLDTLIELLSSFRGVLVSAEFNAANEAALNELFRMKAEKSADLSQVCVVVRELVSEAEREEFVLTPEGSAFLIRLRFYAD